MQQSSALESLRKHVEVRVEELYPRDIYTDTEGAIPPELVCMAQAPSSAEMPVEKSESAYEMKQATMPDAQDAIRRNFMVVLIMVFLNVGKMVIVWTMWRRPLVGNGLAFVIAGKPRLTRMTL